MARSCRICGAPTLLIHVKFTEIIQVQYDDDELELYTQQAESSML